MRFDLSDDEWALLEPPAVLCLGRLEAQADLGLFKRALGAKHDTVKVHVAPAQCQQFAASHSGCR
jgi:hypothetical protein